MNRKVEQRLYFNVGVRTSFLTKKGTNLFSIKRESECFSNTHEHPYLTLMLDLFPLKNVFPNIY